VLIGKYGRRFAGFDDKDYRAVRRGMTTREIPAHVGELYGTEISPDLMSAATKVVLEEGGGVVEPQVGLDLRDYLLPMPSE